MNKISGTGFFPILVNLQKFPCLVVGGGAVASRKVSSLLEFNANVTVVSPKVSGFLDNLSKRGAITLIRKTYSKEYLKDFKIVFCATSNSKINAAVHNDCVTQGILINVADAPSLCDFILPANIKRGNLIVSVSSQGRAPFFAKKIKEKLIGVLPPVYAKIVELAGEYRDRILNEGVYRSPSAKAIMYRRFTEIDWEAVLQGNGKKDTAKYLKEIL